MLTKTILVFAFAAAVSFGGAWYVQREEIQGRLAHAILVTGLLAAGWLCTITAVVVGLAAYLGMAR